MTYRVKSDGLNLRSTPRATSSRNIITVLNRYHEVTKIAEEPEGWWLLDTAVQGRHVRGYAVSRYLESDDSHASDAAVVGQITAVHMGVKKGELQVGHSRAYPLAEPTPIARGGVANDVKAKQLLELVQQLDVEQSERYRPSTGMTFCNIYAYDYCYLAGVYLPRVWWGERAIARLSTGQEVVAVYGETIFEKNANSLYDWLIEWGDDFGWVRTLSLTELQSAANEGCVAIICARRKNRTASGHMTAVVPESQEFGATRRDGEVVRVVESQAGTTNYRFMVRNPWWTSTSSGVAKYDGFGFWYTDATKEFIAI
jgi:hypothetical protein